MDRENALSTIASFDTELYTFFQEEVQRQEVCRRVLPGGDPAGRRYAGMDPGGAHRPDHPSHAGQRPRRLIWQKA